MRLRRRRWSMRLDETDDGRDGGAVLSEKAVSSVRNAGVRARLAGGVDPLDPGPAARPGDETGCVARQRAAAGIVAVMNNEGCGQPVGRAQRRHDHRMEAGDEYGAAWPGAGSERGSHIDGAPAHAHDNDLT